MEQNVPRCIREAWDSVEESQESKTPPILSSEDSSPGPLLFYPKLGHLIWNDQDFNRELSSSPCGLLRQDCWRHGPRAQEHLQGARTSPWLVQSCLSQTRHPRHHRRTQERRLPPKSPTDDRPAASACLSPGAGNFNYSPKHPADPSRASLSDVTT